MFVKVCGITRAEDAAKAVDAGANAIGFIFWPRSPRFIEPERAREIVRSLPAFVTPVGVFVDAPPRDINEIVAVSGIGAVQLHGSESPDVAAAIDRPLIRSLSVLDEAVIAAWPSSVTLLFDAHDPIRRGGTGERADWESAAVLARRRRMLLAGGLNAANVKAAVRSVGPFGIDVSSGVESSPGIKDHRKITDFFEALHQS